MSVYTCESCGSLASTLARCPGCGAVVKNRDQSGTSAGALRRVAPLLLGLFGLALAVPAGTTALDAYEFRAAQNKAASDSLQRVERERQLAEERRVMIARADSILLSTPRSRIAKLKNEQIQSDIVTVGSRSDPLAQRWIKSATAELKRRSSKKGPARAGATGQQ
jgi:hypothetical protein